MQEQSSLRGTNPNSSLIIFAKAKKTFPTIHSLVNIPRSHACTSPFSVIKRFLLFQEKVKAVFDNLIQLEHLNIVKFHKYWADVKENRARVSDSAKRDMTQSGIFLDLVKSRFLQSIICFKAGVGGI